MLRRLAGHAQAQSEMRARTLRPVGAARARPVVVLFREDAAIEPGAAGGAAVVLQFLEAADLLPVGDRIAVHLLQHRGDIRLAFFVGDRIIPGQRLDRLVLRVGAGLIEPFQPPPEMKDEPAFGAAVPGGFDDLVVPLHEPVRVREACRSSRRPATPASGTLRWRCLSGSVRRPAPAVPCTRTRRFRSRRCRARRASRVRPARAAPCRALCPPTAGFWPMTSMPRITPSRIANVIGNCEWSPTMRGSQ